jgi:hypothetical protein
MEALRMRQASSGKSLETRISGSVAFCECPLLAELGMTTGWLKPTQSGRSAGGKH